MKLIGLKTRLTANLRNGTIGAVLTVLCGWFLWLSPVGWSLLRLSYDLPFFVSPKVDVDKVLMITMDELSYRKLDQDYEKKFDRLLHAQLLDNLKEAEIVVFDVFFFDPGSAASNDAFA